MIFTLLNIKMTDITNRTDIAQLIEESPHKKWIKQITIEGTAPFEEYEEKHLFTEFCNIVLDNDIATKGKKEGVKARQTVIKCEPIVSLEEYKKNAEDIYLIVMNGRILKIGGTRVGWKDRFGSYLCGHHVPERGGSRDCSKTNGFIYNTLDFYLQLGCSVKVYIYRLPKAVIVREICGQTIEIAAQTYHAYESVLMSKYMKKYGFMPILCDNADPTY